MFSRILSFIVFSVLSFSSLHVNAQTQEYPFIEKNTLYYEEFYYCSGVLPDIPHGTICLGNPVARNQTIYKTYEGIGAAPGYVTSGNMQSIVDYIFQYAKTVNPPSATRTYSSTGCGNFDANSNIVGCLILFSEFDSTQNQWVNKSQSYNIERIKERSCGYIGLNGGYIEGLGCVNPELPRDEPICTDCPSPMIGGTSPQVTRPQSHHGIDLATGAKVEKSFEISAPFPFGRNYVSAGIRKGHLGIFGHNWKHTYDSKVNIGAILSGGNPSSLVFTKATDEVIVFNYKPSENRYVALFNDHYQYQVGYNSSETTLITPSGVKEVYNSNTGKLIRIVQRGGYTLNFSYGGNLLTSITDSYGKWINLEYSAYADIVVQLTTSAGDTIDYNYNNGMLISQTLNGTKTINYGYQDKNLTSKTNAKNEVVATYSYDPNSGAAVAASRPLGSGVIKAETIKYNSNTIELLSSDGVVKTYTTSVGNYRRNIVGSSASAGGNTINPSSMTMDPNIPGKSGSYTDEEGNVYQYSYDTEGWPATTVRNGKTISFVWNKSLNLPSSITETSPRGTRTTTYQYNIDGLVTKKIVSSSQDGSREWNYTWGTLGKMLTKTDPTGAVTTYTYFSDTDSQMSRRGMVRTISNALGHTITINDYDARGNATSISDAKGLLSTYSYNDMNQVTSKTVGSISVIYTYDNDGLLLQVQNSNGYTLTMTYDQQGRQTSVSDNLGSNISYTLDDNGLPMNTTVAKGGNVQLVKNQIFDGLGRIQQAWANNANEKTTYSYDNSSKFRPSASTNAWGESKSLGYSGSNLVNASGQGDTYSNGVDVDDNITSINVNGKFYQYTYNDFAEVLSYDSPNTGTDNFSYNVAGRTMTRTDAQNITHTTQYDAIGRPTSIVSGNMTKTFGYDSVQVGQMSSAQNGNNTISYSYNSLGLVTQKTQTIGSASKNVGYGYDSNGQMTSMTYPSGLIVNYNRATGVVTSITTSGAASGTILSNVNYQAATFNPLSWSWGNGFTRSSNIDTNGKITGVADGPLNQGYSVGALNNLESLTENGITTTYRYDDAVRLTDAFRTGIFRSQFGYNSTKNRMWQDATEYSDYSYGSGGDQLINWHNDVGENFSPQYDNRGNVTHTGRVGLNYNAQNKVSSTTKSNKTFNYTYNAFGERITKIGPSTNITYVYNESHQLIGEYSGSTIVAEYIYFGAIPVAVYKNNQLYYIHTDHLATPRVITSSGGVTVWKWENLEPFGNNPAQNLGIVFNLRFMGQYFDSESNLYYNYHRYYDPETGRYMQSDPIGLNGGYDTYAYVGNNPLSAVDPLGLKKVFFASPTKDPLMYKSYLNDPDDDEKLIIYAHGHPIGIQFSGDNPISKRTSIAEFYRADGNYIIKNGEGLLNFLKENDIDYTKYKTIELRSCDLGQGELPQSLANKSQRTVLATDDYYFFGEQSIGTKKTIRITDPLNDRQYYGSLWKKDMITYNPKVE